MYPPPDNVINGATDNLDTIINREWPNSRFSTQPLLITEYGWNSNLANRSHQAESIGRQAKFIHDASHNVNKPLFLGGILFEFSDEEWKPDEGHAFDGRHSGLVQFQGISTNGYTTSGHSYPIDILHEKPAYNTYISNIT